MNRTVWRIAADTPTYSADDLSGAGAKATGGRWNEAGLPVLYTSETRTLSCLETIVHLNAGGLPLNRYLIETTIPDRVWAKRERATHVSLPVGWDAEPAGHVSIQFGTDWLRSGRSALLAVPSVVVQEEANILINPVHADAKHITAVKQRRWLYNPRLMKRG